MRARARHVALFATTILILLQESGVATDPPAPNAAPTTLIGTKHLSTPDGDKWTLVFNDEFGGERLDDKKWSIGLPWVGTDGTNRHHNDSYASYIVDDNVSVSNDALHLRTERKTIVAKSGRRFNFTSALVHTRWKFEYTFGYVEARCSVPVEAGAGLWPAFWTLSQGWPPEFDIGEWWTSDNRFHQGLAYKTDAGVSWDDRNIYSPLSLGFHTYGLEWGPGYALLSIDGKVTKLISGDHVPRVPMYLILNSGVASETSALLGTRFPNSFDVDYVRVYSRPDQPVLLNGGFESDSLAPWAPWNGPIAIPYGAHAGQNALRVDATPSSAEQRVFGVRPSTAYVLTAWVRVGGADTEARLGVKQHGSSERSVATRSATYERLRLSFTSGPAATSAIVYCYKPVGDSSAFFDDVAIGLDDSKR